MIEFNLINQGKNKVDDQRVYSSALFNMTVVNVSNVFASVAFTDSCSQNVNVFASAVFSLSIENDY